MKTIWALDHYCVQISRGQQKSHIIPTNVCRQLHTARSKIRYPTVFSAKTGRRDRPGSRHCCGLRASDRPPLDGRGGLFALPPQCCAVRPPYTPFGSHPPVCAQRCLDRCLCVDALAHTHPAHREIKRDFASHCQLADCQSLRVHVSFGPVPRRQGWLSRSRFDIRPLGSSGQRNTS